MNTKKNIAIYGAGVAGLFCALKLLEQGHKVTIFEKTSKIAKKFLIAGSSGLNITHSEKMDLFVTRYGENQDFFKYALSEFSNTDLINWCEEKLKVELFTGSSGRVFPKSMTAGEVIKKWKDLLSSYQDFTLIKDAPFTGFDNDIKPMTENNDSRNYDAYIFALGGASWPSTGSNSLWAKEFQKIGIQTIPFAPMNCGFIINWSDHFKKSLENTHLKNVVLSFNNERKRGEVMLTKYGIEGSAIYAYSRELRTEIEMKGVANLTIDLRPDSTEEQLLQKLNTPRNKNSYSNHIRKALKLSKIEAALLKELLNQDDYLDPRVLAKRIKNFTLKLQSTTHIDEAISTSGGIAMTEINNFCQLKKHPKLFVIGEMLDWDAPTGGYLIQGCFSTAYICSNYFNN